MEIPKAMLNIILQEQHICIWKQHMTNTVSMQHGDLKENGITVLKSKLLDKSGYAFNQQKALSLRLWP